MITKILLLGSGGLLGSHLCGEMAMRGLDFIPLGHGDLDITDRDASLRVLDRETPGAVINAAALCSFVGCERDPGASRKINLDAPIWWGEECAQRGMRNVHFSSDYIFDGALGRPYREGDVPNPLCVYGHHKADLEKALAPMPGALVLRVSWLFGAGGKTFMSLLPGLLMEQETLSVAAGKRGSCLFAGTGAGAVLDLLFAGAGGVVNLAQRGEVSWEMFADFCLGELAGRRLSPGCKKIVHRPFTELSETPGRRPDYSVLDVGLAESLLGRVLPSWQEGVRAYLDALFPASATGGAEK